MVPAYYRWQGPDGEVVEARPCELRRRYGLAKESVKAMASGRQRSHLGWRCLTPRRELRTQRAAGLVRLHRWLDPAGTLVLETVRGLERRLELDSPRSLYALSQGKVQQHRGWQHDGVEAEWPRGRLELRGLGGAVVRKTALELWAEGCSVAEVNQLLAGLTVRGLVRQVQA